MPDDELRSLREKRKQELLAQSLKKDLAQKKENDEIQKARDKHLRSKMIITQVLEPDAITYMDWLEKNRPPIAETIKDTVILILSKNMLRKKLSRIDVMKLERELTGQESKIQVKKRGRKSEDLSERMKKDREINGD
ncbi:MAG: hypothetical protein ACTSO7_05740 [Candidatus Heimdallarchaeota archaeon]